MGKGRMHPHDVARRKLMIGGARAAGMALLPRSGPAAQDGLPVLSGYTPKVTRYWIPKGEHEQSFGLTKKMMEATTDFAWLSRRDRVLVKLALN